MNIIHSRSLAQLSTKMKNQLPNSNPRRYDIQGRYTALIDAGETLLSQGYDYAKPQLIAKTAGVSVGLFYRHFKNKQELLTAVMIKRLELLHNQIIQELENVQDPIQALNLVLILTLRYFQVHQGLIKLFFMQIGYGDTTATEQLRDTRKTYRHVLESIIQRGIKAKIFSILDIEIAINSIIGTINWSLYELLIVNNKNIDSDKLARKILIQILRGLGSQKTDTKLN